MQAEKQAVYGIIFNEARDAVLLIQRRDIPVWVLPEGVSSLAKNQKRRLCARC